MVDTSLLIDYFRKTDKEKSRLIQLSSRYETLAISSITEFEVYTGATPAQVPFWNEILEEIIVFPFGSKAAHLAADMQKDLKKQRKTVEKADLFIAATAVANGLQLDTLNRKHFEIIERLSLLDVIDL